MGGLRDELDPPKANGGTCSVKDFIASRDDPEEWIELMDDESIQHSRIYRLMKKYGYNLTANPVTRHRNGACSCGKSAG